MAARFIPICSQEKGHSIFREYFQGQGGLGTRRREWKDEGGCRGFERLCGRRYFGRPPTAEGGDGHDRIDLERAIAKLSPGYRTAFVLFDLEGYEHHEIAQMMNWSVGNSKSQLHKARRKLRDWLRLQGGKEGSANGTKVASECEAKKISALRDSARARGMNRLAPGVLTR